MDGTRDRADGFTLIEILIVVTIIIMVFGFAMPTLNEYLSNQKLKAVTGRLARGLLIARTRAITQHQQMYAIFFADQLMIASSRLEPPELMPYFSSKKEAAKMRIRLRFAGAKTEEVASKDHPLGLVSDLPRLPPEEDWSKPLTAKSLLESELFTGKRAYLVFNSDGTVVFGRGGGPGDRLSIEFWAEPPRDADIVIEEQGNATRGWIDVRATGNVDTRVKDGTLRADPTEEA